MYEHKHVLQGCVHIVNRIVNSVNILLHIVNSLTHSLIMYSERVSHDEYKYCRNGG